MSLILLGAFVGVELLHHAINYVFRLEGLSKQLFPKAAAHFYIPTSSV